MNEPVAKLMQKDAMLGPLILERTDGVISSSVTFLFFSESIRHIHFHQSSITTNLIWL